MKSNLIKGIWRFLPELIFTGILAYTIAGDIYRSFSRSIDIPSLVIMIVAMGMFIGQYFWRSIPVAVILAFLVVGVCMILIVVDLGSEDEPFPIIPLLLLPVAILMPVKYVKYKYKKIK